MASDGQNGTSDDIANGSGTPDSPAIDTPISAKRRRTGDSTSSASKAASSRGVANLTPEQLARKRANDREAQRAIRERTKNQIDRLNREIQDLKSQQPYHDLQVVLREKEAVHAENEDIKRRLHDVMQLIQPVLLKGTGINISGLSDLAAAAERSHASLPPNGPDSRQPLQGAPEARMAYPAPPTGEVGPYHTQPNAPSPGSHSSASRNWPYAGVPQQATSNVRSWNEEQQAVQGDLPYAQSDERLGVDFLLDGGQRVKMSNGVSPHAPSDPALSPSIPYGSGRYEYWTMLPRNVDATCPLDSVMVDFLAQQRAQAEGGTPTKQLVGPPYPNFTPLINPSKSGYSHPASRVFTDILGTFPDIAQLPEQVAVVYIMFLIMRWEIEPTQENYDRLPEWMTPRPSQLFSPHPAWMDHLPWPRLRDRMVQMQPFLPFENFFIPFTTTLSLNWPYDPKDVLISNPAFQTGASSATSTTQNANQFANNSASPAPSTGQEPNNPRSVDGLTDDPNYVGIDEFIINPAFETHLRDTKNWSLGPSFRNSFPGLADAVKIKER